MDDLMSKLDINSKDPSPNTSSILITPTSESSVVQQFSFTKNWVNIADLPSELILAIFEPLYPNVDSLQLNALKFYHYKHYLSAIQSITAYKEAVKKYVDLRLICSRLNQVLTPIAFREMVITISGSTRLASLTRAFERGANIVRRLIILGAPLNSRRHSYGDAAKTVSDGLRLCSRLESLECYGHHHVFPHRRWLTMAAPNLSSTVTSLVLSPGNSTNGIDLSYALVGLGAHLQTLEITDWITFPIGSQFHLPSTMPRLTNLILRGGLVDMKNLKKLITRATRKKAPQANGTLRSLSILGASRFGVADMMTILSINNLCSQLTVLHWCPSFDNQDSLIPIVEACPNLVDFSYTHTLQWDIFDHLPPKLEYLELRVFSVVGDKWQTRFVYWEGNFVSFLKSGRCPALRKLTILQPRLLCSSQPDDSISSACDDVGVTLSSRELEDFEDAWTFS